jgi:unsaturated rhamnogalacturonyl hydrolase
MLFTATIAAGQQLPQQQTILRAIRLANDYFMSSPRDSVNTWNRAVYYEGLMALYAIDPQKRYYDDAVAWGDRNLWLPCNGVHTRLADDQCCGQTYLDLYNIDAQPRRIAGIKASVDSMLSGDNAADWYWADAIQMAMPVFARLGIIARDTACFRKMYDLYHYTKAVEGGHGLYDPEAHLWWRDKNFAPPYREPNGEGC